MALSVACSRALDGLNAPPVSVEVHLANGLPSFALVGLPDTEVKEARDRVRAAITTSGFEFPAKRITVNLAPADLPKESGRFDLPIALGILAASGQIPANTLAHHEFAGELSLGGDLRPIRGALAMALQTALSGKAFLLPKANVEEAALAGHPAILGSESLLGVCAHLSGQQLIEAATPSLTEHPAEQANLADIRGQGQAKRALEIAAAGQHSLLMSGPPGAGKSMLAQRLPGIMPELPRAIALESAALLSLAGHFEPGLFGQRPFRQPHHTASAVALVGGGNPPRPGEISLAHQGILFLDELPEFNRKVLESLREPLETGHVHIARAARQATFPAAFQLIAAMNPCPCGFHGHPNDKCRCTPDQISRYRNKLSGPLLDRIDLFIEVPAQPADVVLSRPTGENSECVKGRVVQAHHHQHKRQGKPNARLAPNEIELHCALDTPGEQLLIRAAAQLELSTRAIHRILRVARSIADLAESPTIKPAHLAEAIQYRRHPIAGSV